MLRPSHLIIVCGHAIWLGGPCKGSDGSEWIFKSVGRGEHRTYIQHIEAGVKALSEDGQALLVFSGGPTEALTKLSEARSYANVAVVNDYFGLLHHDPSTTPHHPRVLLEERAMDSSQNVLFSIVEFWRHTNYQHWPSHVTIVGHAFKRVRLSEVHCAAIAFPLDRVSYIGIDPPDVALALPSEQRAVEGWRADPQGMSNAARTKRKERNVFGVVQTIFLSESERSRSGVQTILLDEGREEYLKEGSALPWSQPPLK